MKKIESQENLPQNETRASILIHLLSKDLSAIDLEEKLGINESAIRRHLNTLEQMNYVEHYFKKVKKGRPKKLYKLTSTGSNLFPKRTHLLFTLLAKRIQREEGESKLEVLLSKVAKDFANQLAPEKGEGNEKSRLEDFVRALEKFGFYPSLKEEGNTYKITYRNCVFKDVRTELSDQLCRMHTQIVRNVLPNCEIENKKSTEESENQCMHLIKLSRTTS